ncbi:hypothetical protein [Rheinheimera sp. MM224]|uniref:hypothetical protein n=1 Tax=Rheinheimera sp. MM224 TaxID=3019969 RepID=UPI0021F8358A|nr:hypothetical protein [Rheinheimera sp. MM224]CAI3804495.1 hypothetical protein JAMGFMIE_03635 [Rheinheimera sp. MM224]
MNTIRFSSLSAAVVLASLSGLCMAQAEMTVTAAAAAQNTAATVTLQQHQPNTLASSSDTASLGILSASSTSAETNNQVTTNTDGAAQSEALLTSAALSQSTSIAQQSSTAVNTLLPQPAVTIPELPSADSVVPAELPALPGLVNDSARAAVSQSTNALVQQQISTELTKAVDDTIKAEVVNSVQSSLNSVLTLGL